MKLIYRLLFILIVLGLSFQSCSDFVEGFNEDPNNASEAPTDAVMNAAFTGLITGHEGEDARLATMWARHFTGSDRQYSSFNVYLTQAGNFEWDKFYLVRQNALQAMSQAQETDNQLVMGIARVLIAQTIGKVAALWGDVPYREANKFPEIVDPVYDPQAQVYSDLIAELDLAIGNLNAGVGNIGSDFYFNGNADAWKAVAYSLQARLNLHLGNYGAAINAAQNGIQTLDGNWMIPHTGGQYNQDKNIYNSFGVDDREGYMTANDAFLPSLIDPSSANYRGNAKTDETARFNFLFVGPGPDWDLNYSGMWAATAPFPVITAVETMLIMAESHWRQGNMGPALAALNNARALIASKFPGGTYEAYEMADFEAGGMANNGGSADESLLEEIIEEKYISLAGQVEAYNDLRRTGNLLGVQPTTGSRIPGRFLYPQVEIDANSNTPSPIPDLFTPVPLFN